MTSGMRSSEFWVGLIASALGSIAHFYLGVDPVTLGTILAPVTGYILSRGIAKTEQK